MSEPKLTREDCLQLLNEQYLCLQTHGQSRYPQRSDFTQRQVVAIKAFLGPWPRALEAAGIKPPRDDDRIQKNREKRIRAKRNRIAAMKQAQRCKKTNTAATEDSP